jgi:hypothetical protein
MQTSPAFCRFTPLTHKYPPQHPVLRHPQSVLIPNARDHSHAHMKNSQLTVLYILIFNFCLNACTDLKTQQSEQNTSKCFPTAYSVIRKHAAVNPAYSNACGFSALPGEYLSKGNGRRLLPNPYIRTSNCPALRNTAVATVHYITYDSVPLHVVAHNPIDG